MSLSNITRKPRIGFLGIMQELYDKMLPGITERQEGYARSVAGRLAGVAEVRFPRAARCREDIEAIVAGFRAEGVDGILIANLTYGPGLRLVNAFRDLDLPAAGDSSAVVAARSSGWMMAPNRLCNRGTSGSSFAATSKPRNSRMWRLK